MKAKPSIVIPQEVYDKVMWWVNHADGEVSGMGTVTYDADNNQFRVDEAVLLEQECSSAETELDAAAVGKAEYAFRDHKGEGMRWWWHSHVNMNVFWSGTDTTTMGQLGEHGWFLATVFNKREESKSCLYQGKPFPMCVDDLEFLIETPEIDPKLVSEWEADFKAKVKKATPVYSSTFDYRNSYGSKWNTETTTPPLADDGVVYTQSEADSWLTLYKQIEDKLDDQTIPIDEFNTLLQRSEDIENILDECIKRKLLKPTDVYSEDYVLYNRGYYD